MCNNRGLKEINASALTVVFLCGPLGDDIEQTQRYLRACSYCQREAGACEEVVTGTRTVKALSRVGAVCTTGNMIQPLSATLNSFLLVKPTAIPDFVGSLTMPARSSISTFWPFSEDSPSFPFHHSNSYFTSKGQFETLTPPGNFQYQLNPFQLHIKKKKANIRFKWT